jgi:hypothetical protein
MTSTPGRRERGEGKFDKFESLRVHWRYSVAIGNSRNAVEKWLQTEEQH